MNPINRRDFLKTSGLVGSGLLAGGLPSLAHAQAASPPPKIHGVNLGGWLVLEKWITPGLFAGQTAEDEYTLSQALGPVAAAKRLGHHRDTWITDDDFQWLARHGINAVRLPVGYWVAEENPPFVSAWEIVDRAFRLARNHGLKVLLDLHGVPGSQNGWDHSGRKGAVGWPNSPENIAHSLRVIADMAARCQGYDNLLGIELVNEPRDNISLDILKSYYQAGYARVRQHLAPARAAVVLHDSFRPLAWENFMNGPETSNVLLDAHLYQCFSDADHQRDLAGQIEVAAVERKDQLDKMQKQNPCIVGEWSLGLPPAALAGLDPLAREAGMRAFGASQLVSYERTRGWFFWTYRTEAGGGWSFRDCVNRGWLPEKYGA